MNTMDFNRYIRAQHQNYDRGVAKTPPYDPKTAGVPQDMFDSEVDQDGWVRWKILPSTVTETDILSLFKEYGVTPPKTLIEYLKSDFHMIDQVSNEERMTSLPHIPSDNPLGPMKDILEAWKPLIASSYIPIAEMEDGWGPICFKQSDGSIVWFDHELLANLWNPRPPSLSQKIVRRFLKSERPPSTVRDLEQPLFNDIDEFYRDTFENSDDEEA